jgi:hypothetical protein
MMSEKSASDADRENLPERTYTSAGRDATITSMARGEVSPEIAGWSENRYLSAGNLM